MKKVLIDTDIIIDYLRIGKGPLEDLLRQAGDGEIKLYLSSVTILELYCGEIKARQTETIESVERLMEVIPLDNERARLIGKLRKSLKRSVSLADVIIGGSAVFLGAELATRNRKHFEQIPGVKFF